VLYSIHSSFSEIRDFVSVISPKYIFATVDCDPTSLTQIKALSKNLYVTPGKKGGQTIFQLFNFLIWKKVDEEPVRGGREREEGGGEEGGRGGR
jgi:hypothetical protein